MRFGREGWKIGLINDVGTRWYISFNLLFFVLFWGFVIWAILFQASRLLSYAFLVLVGVSGLGLWLRGRSARRTPHVPNAEEARKLAENFYSKGIALLNDGKLNSAIEAYSLAAGIDPSWSLPFLNRGVAYLKAGEPRKALGDFEEALAVVSSDWTSAYQREGASHQSEDAFRVSMLAALHDNIGQAHLALGQNEPALEHFQMAWSEEQQPHLLVHRALAYQGLHDPNQARALLQSFLSDPRTEAEKGYSNEHVRNLITQLDG